ncbi:hypothetical protein CsatA_020892 [Cannabis sativa]
MASMAFFIFACSNPRLSAPYVTICRYWSLSFLSRQCKFRLCVKCSATVRATFNYMNITSTSFISLGTYKHSYHSVQYR